MQNPQETVEYEYEYRKFKRPFPPPAALLVPARAPAPPWSALGAPRHGDHPPPCQPASGGRPQSRAARPGDGLEH